MNKSSLAKNIIALVTLLAVLAVAVITVTSLKYENQRTSKIIPYTDESSLISDGDFLEQKVFPDAGETEMAGFALFLTQEHPNPTSTIAVSFKEDGKVIYSHKESAMTIQYTEYKYFCFDNPVKIKDGSEYKIELQVEGSDNGNKIGVYTGTKDGIDKCSINGIPDSGVACHMLVYEKVPVAKMILIPCVIFAVMIAVTLVILILKKTALKNAKNKELIGFAVFYAALLILFSFIVPQCSVNDEADHFIRSYVVAHGNFVSDVVGDNGQGGSVLPVAFAQYRDEQYRNWHHDGQRDNDEQIKYLTIDRNNMAEVEYTNSSINVPYLYIPQAIGIRIAELFTGRLYILMYAARIMNMIAILVMVLLAVRITPVAKELFMAAACFPFMLQDSVSCSPDSFITALIFVFAALVLYMRYSIEGQMNIKHLVILFLVTVLMCGVKLVYAPLALILFFIPKKKFGDDKKYILSVAVFGAASAVMCLSWLTVITGYNMLLGNLSNHYLQKDLLLTDPMPFIKAVCGVITDFGKYLFDMIGLNIGNENIYTSHLIPVTLILVMAYIIITINRQSPDGKKASWILWLIAPAISAFLVLVSEYFYWTKVGASVMAGVAGRYFLPCAIAVVIGLARPSVTTGQKAVTIGYRKTITFAIALCNLYCLVMYWIYTVY